jgi:hypothetical protein
MIMSFYILVTSLFSYDLVYLFTEEAGLTFCFPMTLVAVQLPWTRSSLIVCVTPFIVPFVQRDIFAFVFEFEKRMLDGLTLGSPRTPGKLRFFNDQ